MHPPSTSLDVSSATPARHTRVLADVGAGFAPRRFLRGALAVPAGVGLVFSDAKLLSLSLVPMLVHVALFVALVWAGFEQGAGRLIAAMTPAAEATGMFSSMVMVFVMVLVGAIVVVAAAVGTVLLGSVICDPFYDLLSEQTEVLLVGRSVGAEFKLAQVPQGLVREFGATLLRLLVWGALALPLWALTFTPVAVVAVPLGLVWTWLFLAYEFLARSLARHAVRPRDRFKPVFAHKALCAGFGGLCWLVSFVPFTAPFLVVGATRLYLSLAVHDRASSLLSEDEKRRLRAVATT